jgi:uncharacterized surface protein with fasciclin (FAS1) repeats
LALLAIFPSFAQEQTIAEIVVASAGAETPEFATLLAAVSAADPAILETLSNPEAELTVFAPTDAAFAALQEGLGEEAFAGVLADTELLSGILLFHVLDGAVMSADVVAALEAGEGAFTAETLLGQYIDVAATEEGGVTVNGANLNLEMVDIAASNGVIHVIDAVILPETRTIAEIVVESTEAETPEFTTLLTAVGAADPAILELLSDAEVELTVFAPTDAAFAALGEETLAAVVADQALLTGILQYHVVPGIVGSADLVDVFTAVAEEMEMTEEDMAAMPWLAGVTEDGALELVSAVEGGTVTITATEEGVFINGAQIVVTDIDAVNGIIHVIDAVILPPTE